MPYTKEVVDYCDLFSCGDEDLDDFFSHDVFLYEEELLGKTYCWINKHNQREIVAIATLSYDGIKTYALDNPSRNALQRRIPQQKRHRSYPAVLIGRLGVNKSFILKMVLSHCIKQSRARRMLLAYQTEMLWEAVSCFLT